MTERGSYDAKRSEKREGKKKGKEGTNMLECLKVKACNHWRNAASLI